MSDLTAADLKRMSYYEVARYMEWESKGKPLPKPLFERPLVPGQKPKKRQKDKPQASHKPFLSTLFVLQFGRCFLCDKPMLGLRTREHVIPKFHGGGNKRNILLAHGKCNTLKGNRMPFACERLYCEIIYSIHEGKQQWATSRR